MLGAHHGHPCREWTAMARDACDGPLQALLAPEADGQAVLPAVWAACSEGVTRGLVLLYEQDPQNISRVLDVCQVGRNQATAPWHRHARAVNRSSPDRTWVALILAQMWNGSAAPSILAVQIYQRHVTLSHRAGGGLLMLRDGCLW